MSKEGLPETGHPVGGAQAKSEPRLPASWQGAMRPPTPALNLYVVSLPISFFSLLITQNLQFSLKTPNLLPISPTEKGQALSHVGESQQPREATTVSFTSLIELRGLVTLNALGKQATRRAAGEQPGAAECVPTSPAALRRGDGARFKPVPRTLSPWAPYTLKRLYTQGESEDANPLGMQYHRCRVPKC